MKKKMIGVAIIFCFIFISSLPASSAEQWSTCTIDRIGISATSGNAYISLTWVASGTSWAGSRVFAVKPGYVNQVLAIALTAQANDNKVLVKLLDIAPSSLIDIIYVRNDL
jgi:hypothetical protein